MNDEQIFPLGCTDADQLFVLTHRLRGSPAFGQFLARDRAGDCYLATTTLSHAQSFGALRHKLEFALDEVAPLVSMGRLFNREPTSYDLLVECMPAGIPSSQFCRGLGSPARIACLALSLADIVKKLHERGQHFLTLRPQTIFVGPEAKEPVIAGIAPRADLFYFSSEKPEDYVSLAFNDTYAAPELWLGEDTKDAADVFSICAILAFWLQGRSPFVGESFRAQIKSIMSNQRAFNLDRFGALGQTVESGLDGNPANRPILDELTATLESIVDLESP